MLGGVLVYLLLLGSMQAVAQYLPLLATSQAISKLNLNGSATSPTFSSDEDISDPEYRVLYRMYM